MAHYFYVYFHLQDYYYYKLHNNLLSMVLQGVIFKDSFKKSLIHFSPSDRFFALARSI